MIAVTAIKTSETSLAIIIPIFDDWESLSMLVERLGTALPDSGCGTHLVLVDDGGAVPPPDLSRLIGRTCFSASLVGLTRNVGSQRAIAVGLCHAVETLRPARVVIMDADGEDRPEDVGALLAMLEANPGSIVVAQRRRRSEGWRFRLFYRFYKGLFALLTGVPISFGNFSAMEYAAARRLVAMHELLLHVPASMIRSRFPIVPVPTDRGRRYAGQSRMNLISLMVHGLSAIAVFSERIFTRILVMCAGIFLVAVLAVLTALTLKAAGLATPGWTTSVASMMIIVILQNAAVALGGLFIVMNNKHDLAIVPSRVAVDLIAATSRLDR